MDDALRMELHRWEQENAQYLRLERRVPHTPRGGMIAGTPRPTWVLTHLPTGVTVTVPPEYSYSEIRCREFAVEVLGAAVIALDLDPGSLH